MISLFTSSIVMSLIKSPPLALEIVPVSSLTTKIRASVSSDVLIAARWRLPSSLATSLWLVTVGKKQPAASILLFLIIAAPS